VNGYVYKQEPGRSKAEVKQAGIDGLGNSFTVTVPSEAITELVIPKAQ
jgi:hypothetical protein